MPLPDPATRVSLGQHSLAGEHPVNQDFHGALLPGGHLLAAKGIALAIADGISSSQVGHVASQTAVRSFLDDYYATAEAWTVRRSAQRVLDAVNAWLYSQTMHGDGRFDRDSGYVCTFSALILKARQLHLLHVGDARVYRLHAQALEQLSEDHRVRHAPGESYLARALGVGSHVEIDYRCWDAEPGEIYLLATDGAHEFLDAAAVHTALNQHGDALDAVAASLVEAARAAGSRDDATVQLLRIDALPPPAADQLRAQRQTLPLPPPVRPGMSFEGFSIVRELQVSARSHVYLAEDEASRTPVVLKLPSTDLRENATYLDGFVLEEWVARRVDSPHVIKAWPGTRPRQSLYVAMEFIAGQTLAQWMIDHPQPSLDAVRGIVVQLAQGLQALHRRDMLHRDLRPENVMIDTSGTVRLIDLASVQVGGLAEAGQTDEAAPPGTVQYLAPECLTGQPATPAADLYALAAIAYRMLSGELPYGLAAARVRTAPEARRLRRLPLASYRPDLPAWVDAVLGKALQVDPRRRQEALSEFVRDLQQPGPQFLSTRRLPLIERDPLRFWKLLSGGLAVLAIVLAFGWHSAT